MLFILKTYHTHNHTLWAKSKNSSWIVSTVVHTIITAFQMVIFDKMTIKFVTHISWTYAHLAINIKTQVKFLFSFTLFSVRYTSDVMSVYPSPK
jgi:hypothetical protein